jgi:hypothetical protein
MAGGVVKMLVANRYTVFANRQINVHDLKLAHDQNSFPLIHNHFVQTFLSTNSFSLSFPTILEVRQSWAMLTLYELKYF